MTSELQKQMEAHGITDLEELTEFDQWVNDATRKDIETVAEQNNWNVFGLQVWTWKRTRGQALKDANNFSVDYIIKNEDEPKISKIIRIYKWKAKKNWSNKLSNETVELLAKAALDLCLWV